MIPTLQIRLGCFSDSSIFTGMFSGHYNHPYGLCYDVLCTDDPIIDNAELEGYNVEESVSQLFYELM